MRDAENAKMLLGLASQDFAATLVLKSSPDVSDRIFGFHAQQVVEKALKAWLALLDVEYPFTHSLNLLFGLIEDELGSETVSRFTSLQALTPFAVQFRYASYDDAGNELDRDGIVVELKKLLEYVGRLLDESEDL